MNQILSTSMPMDNKKKKEKKVNTNPVAIKSILKFFTIGTGAYAVFKNQSEQQEQNLEPSISIEDKDEETILLKVVHKKNIAKLEYRWNDEESTVVNGNNGKYIEKQIKVPSGKNTLHVLVVDEDGKEIPYEKQYERESKINFEVSGNKIKITYEGDKKVSYMTYRWDEEEEKTIQINDTKIDQEIDAIKGLHTLTVIVVDEDNNTDTKVQKINGVSKPKITVAVDDAKQHFVIKASDDEKITTIVFRLNQDDNQYYTLNIADMNYNDIQYVLPMELQSGENTIEVTIKNASGVTEESGIIKYQK